MFYLDIGSLRFKMIPPLQDDGMDTNDLDIPFDTSSIDVIQILDIANSMIQQGGMNQF